MASRGSRHERAAEGLGPRAGRHRQGDREAGACRGPADRYRRRPAGDRVCPWARRSRAARWRSPGSGCCWRSRWPSRCRSGPTSGRAACSSCSSWAATGVTALIGLLGALASWASRRGFAHMLSLAVILWSAMIGLREVLPRVGYAKTVRTWTCEAVPAGPGQQAPTQQSPAPQQGPAPQRAPAPQGSPAPRQAPTGQ